MTNYVIDASILIRAALDQKSSISSKLRHLLKQPDTKIISIPLMRYEFANGVRFSLKDTKISQALVEKMYLIPINIFDFKSNHLSQTIELAYQLNTTIYDTAYHFTAILLNGTFITCDKEYFSKSSHLGHIEFWK